jgi:tetratricopeptide (TPR) repeat protein
MKTHKQLGKGLATLLISQCLAISSLQGAPGSKEEKIRQLINTIVNKQSQLADEISSLQKLLVDSPEIDDLDLRNPRVAMDSRVKVRTEDGIKMYKKEKYEMAKDLFQSAWEEAPNDSITNFNLGMAYHKMGKAALAKKFLKSSVDMDNTFKGSEKIYTYLEGKRKEVDSESDEVKGLRTELINLKKENSSYMASKSLPLHKRMSSVIKSLREMEESAQAHDELIEDYYVEMANTYSAFEHYDKAVRLLDEYENSMEGKVLPDGYHSERLKIVEKQKERSTILNAYMGNQDSLTAGRQLQRDLNELSIFGSQIDEFVQEVSVTNSDLKKINQRLKEYRWGGQANRHVVIFDRYQKLVWSSLPGTVSLDRYQDEEGERFFKNISLLADRMDLKQTEYFTINLNINGSVIPYVIMYTYVPKHEAFIVVRIPQRDLS